MHSHSSTSFFFIQCSFKL